jgi:hypothetical protein
VAFANVPFPPSTVLLDVDPSENVVEFTVSVRRRVVEYADLVDEPEGAGVTSDVRVVVITSWEEFLGVADGARDELDLLELD